MFKDAIRCTHNGAGGSGALTLAAVAGWARPSDWFGTSGTVNVMYEIVEYTDNTYAQIKQYERGIGVLVLSTGVLTRAIVAATATASAGVLTCNDTSASALTITNTAANVRISLGGSVDTALGALPLVQNSSASGWSGNHIGYQSFNTRVTMDGNDATKTLTAGDRMWVPIDFRGGLVSNVAVKCTTLHAAAALRMGLYDWDTDGLPGNLLNEFTSSSQIALTSTGVASVSVATKIRPAPGPYWLCMQSNDSTAAITVASHMGASLMGITPGERELMYFSKSAAYGALPATGDKTPSSLLSRSNGGQLWAGFC